GARAERTARSPEHGHVRGLVGVEVTERVGQGRGGGPVDRVPRLRPVQDDGGDRPRPLRTHAHRPLRSPLPVADGFFGYITDTSWCPVPLRSPGSVASIVVVVTTHTKECRRCHNDHIRG